MNFIEKVKGFLLEPSKTFDTIKEESLKVALKCYVVIAAMYSAILALLLAFTENLIGTLMEFRNMGIKIGSGTLFIGNLERIIGAGTGIDAAIIFIMKSMIILIIGSFIWGGILHIFVQIVGGRSGIAQTIKVCMYGSIPFLLFGWLPVINVIAMIWLIWSLIVQIIGIRQLQELTTRKAILVVLLPIIITIALAGVALWSFIHIIKVGIL